MRDDRRVNVEKTVTLKNQRQPRITWVQISGRHTCSVICRGEEVRRTISYFAVGVDDSAGFLRGQIVQIGTLMLVRHGGKPRKWVTTTTPRQEDNARLR